MHVTTMLIMIVLTSAVMSVAIAIVARNRHPDLLAWAVALGLQLLGYLLLGLRPYMLEAASIVLANGIISASLSMYGYGLYRFFREPPNRLWLLGPLVAVIVTCLLWLTDFRWRVGVLSVVYAVQGVVMLRLLWSQRAGLVGRRGHILLGLGVLIFMFVMLVRTGLAGLDLLHITQNQQSGLFNTVTYMSSLATTMMLSVGILMMAQERAEAQLAVRECEYRQLIEAATDGICIIQDGRVRFVNPRMCQLFGQTDDALVGTSIEQMVAAEDWPTVQKNHRQRLAGQGDELRYPARMHTRHAGVRWFEISGVRIDWHGQAATLNFFNDITARRTMEETIQGMAYHDTLTQLPNRRLLLDRLHQVQQSTQRNHHWAALVFMDLDHFKLLNDTHGHQAGDLLLIEVAQRLLGCVRGMDTVARLGGDEFVVLLSDLGTHGDTARQSALQMGHKMLHALAQSYTLQLEADGSNDTKTEAGAPLSTIDAQHMRRIQHQCSASAGLVLFNNSASSADTLLQQADTAMYDAKKAGRNQLWCHTEHTEQHAMCPPEPEPKAVRA